MVCLSNDVRRSVQNVSSVLSSSTFKTLIVKLRSSFATFSIKNATEMEIDDLERLVIALYGCNEHSDWRKIKAAKKIHSELFNACVDNHGTVDYDTFRYVVRHHGTFMFPVFDIQRVVRNKVLILYIFIAHM